MQPFKIQDKEIGHGNPAYIIAEVSCNHNGNYDEAVRIIEASAKAGADAVKLQTYSADTITRDFKTKPKGSIWEKMDLYDLYKKAMTPWNWQPNLKKVADNLGIALNLFGVNIGLSDHTLFADTKNYTNPMPHITPLESVKLGASIIEVHVIMDRESSKLLMEKEEGGFDWSFSREPQELKKMIDVIREYEATGAYKYNNTEQELASKTYGEVCFKPTEKEISSRKVRPSLWIVKDIKKGERFRFAAEDKQNGNYDSIRPSGGLHIRFADIVNGKRASRDIYAYEMLEWGMIEKI